MAHQFAYVATEEDTEEGFGLGKVEQDFKGIELLPDMGRFSTKDEVMDKVSELNKDLGLTQEEFDLLVEKACPRPAEFTKMLPNEIVVLELEPDGRLTSHRATLQ